MTAPALVAALALASCAAPASSEPARGDRPAIWTEFLSDDAVRGALPLLAEAGFDLNLAVAADRTALDAGIALARDAEEAGVGVRFWPLLARADGYWAGQENAEAFAAYAGRLMDAAEGAGLAARTLYVDVEMHIERAERLQALAAGGSSQGELLPFFLDYIDEAAFGAARDRYARLVADGAARGWSVRCSTLPVVVDDPADGDASIELALGTPVSGIAWPEVSVQLYRTLAQETFGPFLASGGGGAGGADGGGGEAPTFTAALVGDYAADAVALFGDRAAVDLGVIRSQAAFPGSTSGYVDAAPLQDDVAAARAAGVLPGRIHLFSLDGLVERADPAAFLRVAATAPRPAPPDEAVTRLRTLVRDLDALDRR